MTESANSGRAKGVLITVGIVLGLVLAVYGAWRGVVALAEFAIMQTPTEWDVSLGEMASKEIESGAHVCSDPEVVAFAEDMGEALMEEVDDPPFDFSFKVVKDDAINAFALPGGFVYINTGLLERAESSSELAGVLGHEIQHALLRHGMKRVGRSLALTLIVAVAFGGMGDFAVVAAGKVSDIGSLSFDRGDESEADIEGLPLVADAGFEPEGMIEFFKVLREVEEERGVEAATLGGYLSTHPLTDDRIDDIRAAIKKDDIEPEDDFEDRTEELDRRLESIKGKCGSAARNDDDGGGRDRDDDDDDEGRRSGGQPLGLRRRGAGRAGRRQSRRPVTSPARRRPDDGPGPGGGRPGAGAGRWS